MTSKTPAPLPPQTKRPADTENDEKAITTEKQRALRPTEELFSAPLRLRASALKLFTHQLHPWLLLTLLLLPATWPLWLPDLQATHDGLHHLARLYELDAALGSGSLYPRWFPHMAFLYGFPVFHYYAPLTYYLGELVVLLGGGVLSGFEWTLGVGLVAAGWAMYAFARRFGERVGWLAALLYVYWPYHLSNGLVRGAQAELWAMVWVPLLLAAIHDSARAGDRRERLRAGLLVALATALLMLTHNISAFFYTPFVLAFGVWEIGRLGDWRLGDWRLARTSSQSPISNLQSLLSFWLLGLALSAFFWLPALADVGWVRASLLREGMRAENAGLLYGLGGLISPFWLHRYLPEQGTATFEPIPRVAALLWLAGVVGIFLPRRRGGDAEGGRFAAKRQRGKEAERKRFNAEAQRRRGAEEGREYGTQERRGWRSWTFGKSPTSNPPRLLRAPRASAVNSSALFFALVSLAGVGMMHSLSAPLWTDGPFISYLGPPYRFQAIVALGGALTVALGLGRWLEGRRVGGWLLAGALALALALSGTIHLPATPMTVPGSPEPLTEERMDVAAVVAFDFQIGLAARDWGSGWFYEYLPVWVEEPPTEFFLPPAQPAPAAPPLDVAIRAGEQRPLARSWQVSSPTPWTFSLHQFFFPAWQLRVDGATVETAPAGPLGLLSAPIPAGEHTLEVRYGATPSQRAGEVISLLALLLWAGLAWPRRKGLLALVAAPLAGLLLVALLASPGRLAGEVAEIRWDEPVRFGDVAAVAGAGLATPTVAPGGRVWLAVEWLALSAPQSRYKVIFHLEDADGRKWAAGDTEPGLFFTPATRWQPGEVMEDWLTLTVPPDAPPGRYRLLTGMYHPETVENLPISGGEQVGGRLLLAELEVR